MYFKSFHFSIVTIHCLVLNLSGAGTDDSIIIIQFNSVSLTCSIYYVCDGVKVNACAGAQAHSDRIVESMFGFCSRSFSCCNEMR